MMDTSSGTRSPASASARIAPMAMTSAIAKTAVTSGARFRMVCIPV